MMRLNPRRVLASVALAVAVGTATVAGVAIAGSGGGPTPPASTTGGTPTTIGSAAHTALESLVSDGTITQTQADAVQAQVDAGSIDPETLVASGTVSDSQMHAIENVLAQVKQSFARSEGGGPAGPSSTTDGAPAEISAAAHTALEGLVSDGTITQSQAEAVQAQVDAGSVDSERLVQSGTVSGSQMTAIENALGRVKRSFGG